jgi:transposase-like protein
MARVISQATVVAVGVTTEGERQVLGIDVGPSEDRAFWAAFLRSLVKRGLKGVRLGVSDAHEGLKQAIGTVLSGSTWQRCRAHYAEIGIKSTSCATSWRPSPKAPARPSRRSSVPRRRRP